MAFGRFARLFVTGGIALALTGWRAIGIVTPVGGALLIGAWLAAAWGARRA